MKFQPELRKKRGRGSVNAKFQSYSDLRLIEAIARDRDPEALTVLFLRHQNVAYNLALRLVHRSDTAEDIMQETMLTVWKSAGSYREIGEVRSWVLRMVALKSFKKIRGWSRENKHIEKLSISNGSSVQPSVGNSQEQQEIVSALRQAVDELSVSEQQLLALRFGGGLTYAEIGKELNTPGRTISFRLEKCVAKLRSCLSGAGFASAGSLASGEELAVVLLSGQRVPPSLTQSLGSVVEKLDLATSSTRPLSHSMTLMLAGGLAWAVVAVVAWTMESEPVVKEATFISKPTSVAENDLKLQPEPDRLSALWDFKKRSPLDLKAVRGSWKWEAGLRIDGKKVKGGMLVSAQKETFIPLPLIIPRRPIVVDIRFHIPLTVLRRKARKWSWTCGALWNFDGHIEFEKLYKNKDADIAPEGARFRAYFFDRYVVEVIDADKSFYIQKYKTPFPASKIALAFNHVVIERIKIQEITWEEIPSAWKDPEALAASLNAEALKKVPSTSK